MVAQSREAIAVRAPPMHEVVSLPDAGLEQVVATVKAHVIPRPRRRQRPKFGSRDEPSKSVQFPRGERPARPGYRPPIRYRVELLDHSLAGVGLDPNEGARPALACLESISLAGRLTPKRGLTGSA